MAVDTCAGTGAELEVQPMPVPMSMPMMAAAVASPSGDVASVSKGRPASAVSAVQVRPRAVNNNSPPHSPTAVKMAEVTGGRSDDQHGSCNSTGSVAQSGAEAGAEAEAGAGAGAGARHASVGASV